MLISAAARDSGTAVVVVMETISKLLKNVKLSV
ncbi:unnamed protein product [Larinioides sclopetarius]|uniref:Uncharacterized protein n=1 Tax=Larinioides sclopetarius TaxID=280406 RepID=A0AAV1Z906_9ARAC